MQAVDKDPSCKINTNGTDGGDEQAGQLAHFLGKVHATQDIGQLGDVSLSD